MVIQKNNLYSFIIALQWYDITDLCATMRCKIKQVLIDRQVDIKIRSIELFFLIKKETLLGNTPDLNMVNTLAMFQSSTLKRKGTLEHKDFQAQEHYQGATAQRYFILTK